MDWDWNQIAMVAVFLLRLIYHNFFKRETR